MGGELAVFNATPPLSSSPTGEEEDEALGIY
jgi:hypothetical protein